MDTRTRVLTVTLIVGGLIVAGCSPEASRTRGGGRGADPGNRGDTVELHGKRAPGQMYYRTPAVGQGVQIQR